jgi:hypothetical protein
VRVSNCRPQTDFQERRLQIASLRLEVRNTQSIRHRTCGRPSALVCLDQARFLMHVAPQHLSRPCDKRDPLRIAVKQFDLATAGPARVRQASHFGRRRGPVKITPPVEPGANLE